MIIATRNHKKKEFLLDYLNKQTYRMDPEGTKEYRMVQEKLSHEIKRLSHDRLRFVDASHKDKERILDMVETVESLNPNYLIQDSFDLLKKVNHKEFSIYSNWCQTHTFVLNKIGLPKSFKSGSYINLKLEYICDLYFILRIDVLLDKTRGGNLNYRILDVTFKRKEE